MSSSPPQSVKPPSNKNPAYAPELGTLIPSFLQTLVLWARLLRDQQLRGDPDPGRERADTGGHHARPLPRHPPPAQAKALAALRALHHCGRVGALLRVVRAQPGIFKVRAKNS